MHIFRLLTGVQVKHQIVPNLYKQNKNMSATARTAVLLLFAYNEFVLERLKLVIVQTITCT